MDEETPIAAGNYWLQQTPARRFRTGGFGIRRYPVTNSEYAEYLQKHPLAPLPDGWRRTEQGRARYPWGQRWHPVAGVSFREAQAFCAWRGLTLPSPDEWELAARGPNGTTYPWGDDFDAERCNAGKTRQGTTAVFCYPAGRSDFGMWDAVGNVREWAVSAAAGAVLMGGSWADPPHECLPSVRRPWDDLDVRLPFVGFRCARRK